MNLKEAIKILEKKYGKNTLTTLDDEKCLDIETIPTGSLSLDLALGVNGIPRGRIIEIYGPESSGKTTLALAFLAQAQKQGLRCAFIDAEHSLDAEYASNIGINLKELYLNQPSSGEQALDVVENLVKTGEVGMIVIDSVSALTPQAEIDGEMGQMHIGLQARLMSQALRKLTGLASKTKTTIVFINQTRMMIGVRWGNPITTSGGVALKFYTSVRIEIKIALRLKLKDEHVGNRIQAKVVKNKLASPFKIAEFDIIFNKGIDYVLDTLNVGLQTKVLRKEANTIYYDKTKLGGSTAASKEFLKQNQDILNEIIKKIKHKKE
jgi:recombination protein RecA